MENPGRSKKKPDEFVQSFALRLHLLRIRRQLSQEDAADAAGVHRTFWGQMERAQRGVNIAQLPGIARALGISVPQLFVSETELAAALQAEDPFKQLPNRGSARGLK